MNITSTDLITNIVGILKKDLTNENCYELDENKIILKECVNKDKEIGKKTIDIITNLVIDSTKYDSNKKKKVIEYLKKYLSKEELQYVEENQNDIKAIISFATKKVSN